MDFTTSSDSSDSSSDAPKQQTSTNTTNIIANDDMEFDADDMQTTTTNMTTGSPRERNLLDESTDHVETPSGVEAVQSAVATMAIVESNTAPVNDTGGLADTTAATTTTTATTTTAATTTTTTATTITSTPASESKTTTVSSTKTSASSGATSFATDWGAFGNHGSMSDKSHSPEAQGNLLDVDVETSIVAVQQPQPIANADSWGDFSAQLGNAIVSPNDSFVNQLAVAPTNASVDATGFGGFTVTTAPFVSTPGDDFGDFGNPAAQLKAPSEAQPVKTVGNVNVNDDFGDFGESPRGGDTNDDFGDFGGSATAKANDDFGDFGKVAATTKENVGFGDFGAATSTTKGNDDFGDFGGFATTKENDDFGDFGAAASTTKGDDDFGDFGAPASRETANNDFGDFNAVTTTKIATQPPAVAAPAPIPMPLPHITREQYAEYIAMLRSPTASTKELASLMGRIVDPSLDVDEHCPQSDTLDWTTVLSTMGFYERGATSETTTSNETTTTSNNPSFTSTNPMTRPIRSAFSNEMWYTPLQRIQFESNYPENSINRLRWRRCMIRRLSLISLNVPLDESGMM